MKSCTLKTLEKTCIEGLRELNYSKITSQEKALKLASDIWLEHGQDVDQSVTVFYLPDMDTSSVAYAFGRCMKNERCYVTVGH